VVPGVWRALGDAGLNECPSRRPREGTTRMMSELTRPVIPGRPGRYWQIATRLRTHLQEKIDLGLEVREHVVCRRSV
jgi:hypothetical protein